MTDYSEMDGESLAMAIRYDALNKAVRAHEGIFTAGDLVRIGRDGMQPVSRGDEILSTARAFEAYLRGPDYVITNNPPASDLTGPHRLADDTPAGGTE